MSEEAPDFILVAALCIMAFGCTTMAIFPLLAQSVLAAKSLRSGYGHSSSSTHLPGKASYVAPAGYPTTAFSSYYPVPSGQEPQPALYDPILNFTYPLNLTNPDTIPDNDPDPVYFPKPTANLTLSEQQDQISAALKDIAAIISGSSTNCTKCIDSLVRAKKAVQVAPTLAPNAMVDTCIKYKFHSNDTCKEHFEATTFGAIWTQILAFADVGGLDGHYICSSLSSTFCSAPATSPLNVSAWIPKPRPKHVKLPKPSGKLVKVLHMSDFHLDPRFKVNAEANCTSGFCCRTNSNNSMSMGQIGFPAPPFGAYKCDSPYDLGLAALQAISSLTGTSKEHPLAWTVYTGDLVSHDPQDQLSRLYTEYAETSVYGMFKKYITGPVFAALGNHDTNPEAIDAPHSLPGPLGEQMSWNYDHVAGLWKHEGWIDGKAAKQARLHYGAYSIKNHHGLRLISANTDFWYKSNFLNFINTSNPDVSGTWKFVISELQKAEDAGEKVWLFGHVLSGWDGSNPLPNPSNLFYQIIARYSPHVIRNVFFGHTHEDQVMIYYANNGTSRTAETALTAGWIGPSITPLNNVNSGFRLYEVDTGTFDIVDAYTYIADVNSFPALQNTTHGPTFKFEYSTREAYGKAAGWPADAPLNATFWHRVTEAMERDHGLVSLFNTYQGKSSVLSPNCTNEACARAKVCYIRSGSVALGRQCPQGYASVQSPFKPPTGA